MFTDMNQNSLSYSSPWMNANIDVHFDDIRNHECLIVYGDRVMRKILSILLIITVVLTTCSCTVSSASAPGTQYGSFTIKKTSSYDGKYYAFMTQNDQMIVVNIYSNDDSEVFTFKPCRKNDFWGICWENNSYNLWVQSGDIGTICYTMSNKVWSVDESAVRPDYIITK